MNEQRSQFNVDLQRPSIDERSAWHDYWQALGQSWRNEPEIDEERKKYLADRRNIIPDIERGIYPFKDIKLSRADIEWLLATHEHGQGPIDWSNQSQRQRDGLDLRGADLRQVDLSKLPLSSMIGGLLNDEWFEATADQRTIAAVLLEQTSLYKTHLEGAYLAGAHLEQADLRRAYLIDIDLNGAYLTRAFLHDANLKGAKLKMAHLEEASLPRSVLLRVDAEGVHLEGANLREAQLEGANLRGAWLGGTDLSGAQLEGANLREAKLEGTDLSGAKLEGANLRDAQIVGASLRDVILSEKLHLGPQVADVQWGDTNLAVVDWSQVTRLGDDYEANLQMTPDGKVKDRYTRLREYQTAVRANRQLSIALQAQGLTEDAARFAYRTQRLQRVILRRKRRFESYIFSVFLDLLAGYGYKPFRSILWYLITIFAFALIYSIYGHLPILPDAFVFSLTTLLGRGFIPGLSGEINLHTPLVVLAAIEAFFGLLIEIVLIAIVTRRFFDR